MSEPLTDDQLANVRNCAAELAFQEWDETERADLDAAITRLDFLERKLIAAEKLARRLAFSTCVMAGISKAHDAQNVLNRQAIDDYDDVTE